MITQAINMVAVRSIHITTTVGPGPCVVIDRNVKLD